MISFIHMSALLGLLAIATPIIIHLIKHNKRIQTIPSLLLFTALKKTSRKHQLQNLILLLFRILIIMFLVFLLARPFIEWSRQFIKAGDDRKVALAIVLDDSLSSLLSVKGVTYFDMAREKLIKQLNGLTDDSIIFLATTSSGVCSKPMSAKFAAETLRKMESVPVVGNMEGAVENAWRQLREVEGYSFGGLLICAPPVADLWSPLDTKGLGIPPELIGIDIISAEKVDPVIEKVTLAEENGKPGYDIHFDGNPYQLTRAMIEVRNPSGEKLYTTRLDLETALKHKVFVPMDKIGGMEMISAHINVISNKEHSSFAGFYYEPIREKQQQTILILYDKSKLSEVYAQLTFVALEAITENNEGAVSFINCDNNADALKSSLRPGTVFVCPLNDYGKVRNWLGEYLTAGKKAVFFPSNPATKVKLPGITDELCPEFKPIESLKEAKPLILINSPNLNKIFIRIYGKGLNHVRLKQITPMVSSPNDVRIFACDSKPVLLVRSLPSGGRIFLWGINLNKNSLSLLSNPLFPQLVKVIALGKADQQHASTLYLGSSIDIGQWLNVPSGVCECRMPNGFQRDFSWEQKRPEVFYLNQAGFYHFKIEPRLKDEKEKVRVDAIRSVNCPRIPLTVLSEKQLQEKYPGKVNWLSAQQEMTFREIPRKDVKAKGNNKVIEDLTPLVALLLWVFLLGEMIVLTLTIFQGGLRVKH